MSDPRGPGWSDPASSGYPPNTDPAYGQYPSQHWGPIYSGPGYSSTGYGAPVTHPTEQLPPTWGPGGYQTGYQTGTQPPVGPPPPPKTPRWLWVAAAAAVLLVTGLVLALVIVSSSSRDSTVVAPIPQTTPTTRLTTPTRVPTAPSTTTRIPRPTTSARPEPTTTAEPLPPVPPIPPTEATPPGPVGTETVVYNVTGPGRAINITYVDSGGVLQTEFNVALPWSKEVSLAVPAKRAASVTVINVGRDVTCSVTVNGAQVRQRTGQGLTICAGIG